MVTTLLSCTVPDFGHVALVHVNGCVLAVSSTVFLSQGRESMSPIQLSGKAVIKTSSNLLVAAKSLAVNPNDAATWQLLASHSKSVGESVRALLSSLK